MRLCSGGPGPRLQSQLNCQHADRRKPDDRHRRRLTTIPRRRRPRLLLRPIWPPIQPRKIPGGLRHSHRRPTARWTPTGGWELEESLDIEYAHAMAPKAMLYLVEANSNSYADLLTAVRVASNLVRCGQTTACPAGATGKGEVSMSWGGGEFPRRLSLDSYFTAPTSSTSLAPAMVPVAAIPALRPMSFAAGGTSTARSLSHGQPDRGNRLVRSRRRHQLL